MSHGLITTPLKIKGNGSVTDQEILDSFLCWQADGHGLLGHRCHADGGVASQGTVLFTVASSHITNNDDLLSGVHKSVHATQKIGLLHSSESC